MRINLPDKHTSAMIIIMVAIVVLGICAIGTLFIPEEEKTPEPYSTLVSPDAEKKITNTERFYINVGSYDTASHETWYGDIAEITITVKTYYPNTQVRVYIDDTLKSTTYYDKEGTYNIVIYHIDRLSDYMGQKLLNHVFVETYI